MEASSLGTGLESTNAVKFRLPTVFDRMTQTKLGPEQSGESTRTQLWRTGAVGAHGSIVQKFVTVLERTTRAQVSK